MGSPLPDLPAELQNLPAWVRIDVELVVERTALNEIRESTNMDRTVHPDGHQYFHMSHQHFELWGEMSPSAYPEEQGRALWTGRVGGMRDLQGRSFDFVVQQFGSIEPVTLLAGILVLIYIERRTRQAAAECYRNAKQSCGDRGIKQVTAKRRVFSLARLSFSNDCSFDCN